MRAAFVQQGLVAGAAQREGSRARGECPEVAVTGSLVGVHYIAIVSPEAHLGFYFLAVSSCSKK